MQYGWNCPLNILRGHTHTLKFLNYDVFLSLKIVLTTAKSVDTDEMPHFVAFHLGLHCLPKYLFRGF